MPIPTHQPVLLYPTTTNNQKIRKCFPWDMWSQPGTFSHLFDLLLMQHHDTKESVISNLLHNWAHIYWRLPIGTVNPSRAWPCLLHWPTAMDNWGIVRISTQDLLKIAVVAVVAVVLSLFRSHLLASAVCTIKYCSCIIKKESNNVLNSNSAASSAILYPAE